MGVRVDTGAPVLWVTGQGLEPGSLFPVQQMFGAERVRVERSPRSSRFRAPSCLPAPPDPGSPDLGQVWGSRAPPPPASRHLGALRRPPWTAPNRCSSSYSPALPGARPPATSATPATARRSISVRRREAGTAAMSGPGVSSHGMLGPSLAAAAARGNPAPAAWTFTDWLRRSQAPPLSLWEFPKPAGGGNIPETPSLC